MVVRDCRAGNSLCRLRNSLAALAQTVLAGAGNTPHGNRCFGWCSSTQA